MPSASSKSSITRSRAGVSDGPGPDVELELEVELELSSHPKLSVRQSAEMKESDDGKAGARRILMSSNTACPMPRPGFSQSWFRLQPRHKLAFRPTSQSNPEPLPIRSR